MKGLFGVFTLSMLAGCGLQSGPQLITSPEGRFQASFPARMKESSNLVDSIDVHVYATEAEKVGYMVMYNDYPADYVKRHGANRIIEAAKGGSLTNINGKLLDGSDLELNGHPGRGYRFTATKNGKDMLADVEERMYQVGVMGDSAKFSSEKADEFFNSFSLLGE